MGVGKEDLIEDDVLVGGARRTIEEDGLDWVLELMYVPVISLCKHKGEI